MRYQFYIWIAAAVLSFSTSQVEAADSVTIGEWSMGLGYTEGGEEQLFRSASTEAVDKSSDLILDGCSEDIDTKEKRSGGENAPLSSLSFIFGASERFEGQAQETEIKAGTFLWWLRFIPEGDVTEYPVVADVGMDGYYFSVDLPSIFSGRSDLLICTGRDVDARSCSQFSLAGFVDAVRFVCGKNVQPL